MFHKSQRNWDDIPSLGGLEMDWDYEPENPLGKRAFARITKKELYILLGKKQVNVKIATANGQINGFLADLSQGGLSIISKNSLDNGQYVKIGMIVGGKKIISKAIVRNVRVENGDNIIGFEFIDLQKEMSDYITTIYPSVKIKD